MLLELPRLQSAIGLQSQIQAIMPRQILWRLWLRVLFEILESRDSGHAQIRSDTDVDHVFLDLFAKPDTGVIPFCDDTGKAGVDDSLNMDGG